MPRGNPQNLKSLGDRTIEERREIARRAGIASGKARRDKTKLKDCLETLLERKIIDDDSGKKITGAEAMTIALFRRALAGDDKAWELFRDTVGQKLPDKVEQTNTNIVIDFGEISEDDN